MRLGEFYDRVRTEGNLGDRLDTRIPLAVKEAAIWAEQTYNIPYMFRFMVINMPVSVESPEVAPLPCRLKRVGKVYVHLTADRRVEVFRATETEMNIIGEGNDPQFYWIDGDRYVWFSKRFVEETRVTMSGYVFTEWPEDEMADDLWLIDNCFGYMMAKTLMNLAPFARAPELVALYQPAMVDALRSLTQYITEFDLGGNRGGLKYYWPAGVRR